MVLEATMICIDNSEWMRNGDYPPTRFQAQTDAVSLICGAKTQSNPENTVGILTMSGKGVRVLVTPTSDLGRILGCLHGVEMGGEMNVASGIQVAQLALKHRQNKNQHQRIVVFAGSPVTVEKKALEAIGKKLKKNNVSLDIVNFGEDDGGKQEKLDALINAVNSNDSSHIVHVPSGPNVLSDVLISTPVFATDGSTAAAAAASGMGAFEFGVDPNEDPELALALRVSMEEERARQEAAAKKAADEASKQDKGDAQASSSKDATMAEADDGSIAQKTVKPADGVDEENALLQHAIAMSMDDASDGSASQSKAAARDTEMSDANPDDQDLVFALQMSVQENQDPKDAATNEMTNVLGDQSFVSSILASLPGVDPNDPSVKELLASLQGQSEVKGKDEDKTDKSDGK